MTMLLNYQQQGNGPDVFLIHGLLGSLDNLNMVARGLSDRYTVTSVDVRNHGDSFHENTMDYLSLSQDIINVMKHLNIEKTSILGHSMGGKIAMEVALSSPEKVDKLIIADISPVTYPAHHNHIITGLKSINLNLVKNRKDADKQLAHYVDEMAVRAFLLRNLTAKNGQYTFKCNIENIDNCYPQIMLGYQGISSFEGKTLFIKGADSNYILPEHRIKIGTHFPNSKAKIIQGAGHWLHAEKTIAFNKIVGEFLAS